MNLKGQWTSLFCFTMNKSPLSERDRGGDWEKEGEREGERKGKREREMNAGAQIFLLLFSLGL